MGQMNISTLVTHGSRRSLSNMFGLNHLPHLQGGSLEAELLTGFPGLGNALPPSVGIREENCLKPTLYMIISVPGTL